MRPVALLALLLLGGCLGPALSPEDQARTPHITVTQASATDPPVFSWAPQEATWVEVRHERSGRVVWRIEQRSSPHGPAYLRSPLIYGAYAPGPSWSPPPDAAEPWTVMPAASLAPGHHYTVTVHRIDLAGPIGQPARARAYEATIRFRASNTIPHEGGPFR